MAATGPETGTAHLIAPSSALTWFNYFAQLTAADRVFAAGEGPQIAPTVLAELLAGPQRLVVFHSSHDTMHRDHALADSLRPHGYRSFVQSRTCADLGRDKFAMKQFFDDNGIVTTRWTRDPDVRSLGPYGTPIVVKKRHGTQSEGTRLSAVGQCTLAADELAETFTEGIEYSVVVYRDEHGDATFPPVWKGPVDRALTPPWRRLRMCPAPGLDPGLERELRETAVNIVAVADGRGHVEVEFLVDGAQTVLALEFNPRVSGTMRISAMATGLPIFSLYRLPGQRGPLPDRAAAAEVPYTGPPLSDPANGVFGTSRLTVAGRDFAEVRAKILANGRSALSAGGCDALTAAADDARGS